MSSTGITISKLPLEIQQQIPFSIRLYKDEYELDELPPDIQNLILSSISNIKELNDIGQNIFDVRLDINIKGDLKHINNLKDLVLEYLKTYFGITSGYPFDPKFSNKLKRYLHKLNIGIVRQLIDEEVEKIIDVIRSDLGVAIKIIDTKIDYADEEVIIIINFTLNSEKISFRATY
jgi:hypothetical protein